MTHLADAADRIDRSYSPRGGREERELVVSSMSVAVGNHMQTYTQRNTWFVRLISSLDTMIRCPCEIATSIVHVGCVLPFRFFGAIHMNRMRLLALSLVVLSASAQAAIVSGKVSFVSKRGQNPVINETLVWLEPAGGKVIHKSPAT